MSSTEASGGALYRPVHCDNTVNRVRLNTRSGMTHSFERHGISKMMFTMVLR